MPDAVVELEARLKNLVSVEIDKIQKDYRELAGEVKKQNSKMRKGWKETASVFKGAFAANIASSAVNMGIRGLRSFAAATLESGMQLEDFQVQLAAVEPTAEDAAEALDMLREFARPVALQTQEVIQSFVQLRAVGIQPTTEQLRTIGGVSKTFGRDMRDVSQALIGLEAEVLRRLGIQLDRTGKKAKIMSGTYVTEVDKMDQAGIRSAIIDMWEKRFPDALDKASGSLSGMVSTFQSKLFEFQATLVTELMPTIKGLFTTVTDEFDRLSEALIDNNVHVLVYAGCHQKTIRRAIVRREVCAPASHG